MLTDRTAKAIALLRFAENELKHLAEAEVNDERAQRIADLQRLVRTIIGELTGST